MINTTKKFDLEDRTLLFSKAILLFCKTLRQTPITTPMISQVVRSATSIGANYREANDSLGKKDFAHRLRIARKEAKETSYWLELLLEIDIDNNLEINKLLQECRELRNILSAIITKVSSK